MNESFALMSLLSQGWLILPFVSLLMGIAVLPVCAPHFWERAHPWMAVGLGTFVAAVYGFGRGAWAPVLHALEEYASFMLLISALYVVSGGLCLRTEGEAAPLANTAFLAVGVVLANLLGTTGASMLLIRPWIRLNRYRITAFHIVFFIFLVSNAGGCLTPIGDPPLFVGFLKGVPFWWPLQNLWREWLMVVLVLLVLFYVLDCRNFRRAPVKLRETLTAHERLSVEGAWNGLAAVGVSAACFLPGGWREGALILIATLSWKLTPARVHEANGLEFAPLREIAWLFAGLFVCMIPAIEWLELGARALPLPSPAALLWLTGAASAVLDNAPTYAAFLAAAGGSTGIRVESEMTTFLARHAPLIKAISLGSVWFGAMTYLGNGPNLLVKRIAEQERVHTPGFGRYVLGYSLPILIPLYWLVSKLAF
jgi:Na+/H+ antiporter NhaD/arsenite permease-like protein